MLGKDLARLSLYMLENEMLKALQHVNESC